MTKTPLQRKPVSRVPVQKSNIPTDQEYRKSFSTCNLSTSNNDVVPASTENSRPPSILYTNETLTTNSTASNDFFISDHITQISTLKDKKITSLEQPGGFKRSNSQYKAPVTQHRRAYSLMRPRQRKNTVIDPHNFMVNNNNNDEAKIKWVNSVKKSQLHTLKSVEQLPDSKILDFSYNELINEVAPTDFSLKTKSDNSLDEKLRIVQSSFRLLEGSTKASLQPPQFYVDILKLYVARKKLESNTPLSSVGLRGVQILESISRTLSRQPELFEILADLKGSAPSFTTTWTQGFLELGGFEILFHILKTVQLKKDRKTKHLDIELSIVRVLRHLIVQEGPRRLLKIFTNTENIQVVVNILDHPTIVAHTCFAELLLSVVTLGKDGLESVHQAFQKLKEKYKEPRTYCTFISLLRKVVQGRGVFGTDVGARKWSGADIFGSGDKSSTKIKDQREDIIEFVTTFVALLRYMTEYTADLVARIHLRNTFNSCGLNEIFQTIKTFSDDYQDACNHIEEFESAAEMDLTEFASNSEFRFEYDPLDPLAIVYNLQSNLVNEEESWRSVVSILQTMSLSLKIHDKSYRKLMFGVISEVVSQLILDQRGFCSESRSFAQIDVAKLGEKQAKKQIEQVESEKSKLEKKLEEAHEKIRNHDKETADTIESLKARHAEQLMNLQSELANITQQVKEKESEKLIENEILETKIEEINATEESQSNDDPTTAVSQTSDQNISMATSTSILGLPPPPPPLPDAPRPSIFKQKIVPAVKMKCLQWEKLSDRSIKSTIWEKINDSSKLEEEQKLLQKHGVFKELEENFAAKAAVSDKFNNGFAKNAAKVQILGSTVAQNVAIAIKQNKSATPETIKNAIIKMNEEILKENIIDSILSNYPDKTVLAKIRDYSENPSVLRDTERIYFELLFIPECQDRLTCILFKLRYNEKIQHIEKELERIISGLNTLLEAKILPELLKLLLLVGNYLNHESIRGNAAGFQISNINRISSTKSSDGSKSLLSFLCELIQTRFPHLEQITTELKDIPAISKLSLNTIELIFTTEIQDTFTNEVLVSFEKVKKLDSQLDNNDRFIEVMQPFVALVQADIKSFKSKSASCLNLFKDVLSLYGEPVESAMAPEEFMLIFVEFLQSFEATMLENRKEMERKQKEEYLLNARKKRNITKNQSSNNNTPEPNNLLQTLKKGTLSKLENAQNTPAKQPGSFESSRKISTSLIHEQALEMLGEIQNEKQNESKNQILPLEDLLLPSLSTSMSFGEDFFKDILTVDEKCKDFM